MKKLLRGLCLAISIALIGFALVGCGGGGGSSDKKATANITVTVDDPSAKTSMRAADAGGEVYVQAYNSTGNSTVGASGKATLKNGKYTANLIDLPKTNDLIVKAFHSGTKDDFFKALLPINNIIDNGSLAVNAESSVCANAYSKWISVNKPTNATMANFKTNLNKALGTQNVMEYFGVSKENANDATKITEEKIKTIGVNPSKDDPTKDITYISATFTPSNNQPLPVASKIITVTFEEEVEWANSYFKMEPNDSACTYSYSNKVLTVTREKDWAANSEYVIGINAGLKVKGATNKQVTAYANTYTTESGSSSDDPNAKYFAGGKGIADDPYLINTAEQLKAISTNETTLKASYKLGADIALTGEWTPIGSSDEEEIGIFVGYSTKYDKKFFSGSLDGNNKTISGLTINKPEENYVGMFRAIKAATFKNIKFSDARVDGLGNVGVLVGYIKADADNALIVENCSVASGSIAGKNSIGGLVGQSYGAGSVNYTNCAVENTNIEEKRVSTAAGQTFMGGIVGNSMHSNFTNCKYSGDLTGFGSVAGIGSGIDSAFTKCEVSGTLTSDESEQVVGVYGIGSGASYNSCKVSGSIIVNGQYKTDYHKLGADVGPAKIVNCDYTNVKLCVNGKLIEE